MEGVTSPDNGVISPDNEGMTSPDLIMLVEEPLQNLPRLEIQPLTQMDHCKINLIVLSYCKYCKKMLYTSRNRLISPYIACSIIQKFQCTKNHDLMNSNL